MLTFVVTNTDDAGPGSLRQAILDANAEADDEVIEFQIPITDPNFVDADAAVAGGDASADVFVIRPTTELPALTGEVVIDGLTQRLFTGRTSLSDRHAEIVIDGSLAGANVTGITLAGDLNSVVGLNIQNFTGNGVSVIGSGNTILQSMIGLDASGTVAAANGNYGIELAGDDNIISGASFVLEDGSIVMGPGNVISGNTINGIHVSSGSDNVIAGNLIGTDWTGTQAVANEGNGVEIAATAEDTIVGRVDRNVISGNGAFGVTVFGQRTLIEGNYIGVDTTGQVALGNVLTGVNIDIDSNDNVIGGDTRESRNVISGNDEAGIAVRGTGNRVIGNYIGTDQSGTSPLGNGLSGVFISAADNFVGGVNPGEANLISANAVNGIRIFGDVALNNVVLGNFVGTDVTGTQALGNTLAGVAIEEGASNNRIGGPGDGERNLISANQEFGVLVQTDETTDNVVQGNFIGTDVTGTQALGNVLSGVAIQGGASNNRIGGPGAGERNLISANHEAGVVIQDDGTTENVVQGNSIGTDVTGTQALGNVHSGVGIEDGASNNQIGGSGDGEGNLLSGNVEAGVRLSNTGSDQNKVFGNLIGTDLTGSLPLGNGLSGIIITDGASNNVVGGANSGEANLISANSESGVLMRSVGTSANAIQGNFIGTDLAGTQALGNLLNGISIEGGASGNLVGGDATGDGNLISGNLGAGIALFDSGTSGNRIQGNLIGIGSAGHEPLPLPNRFQGVAFVDGASQNIVGGDSPSASNTIAHNDGAGVLVTSVSEADDSVRNLIRLNQIFSNGGLGIELSVSSEASFHDPGLNPNDPADSDEGANRFQNYPDNLQAIIDNDGNLVMSFRVDTIEPNGEFPLTVDFYSANEDGQEGDTYLGTILWPGRDDSADQYVLLEEAAHLEGSLIVATATDAEGNTSEFSPPVLVGRGPLPEVGPKVVKSATSAVEQAIVGQVEQEQTPVAEGLLDLSSSRSILITDDPTIDIPLIETIVIPSAGQEAAVVHIAVGQPPDGSIAKVDAISIAANEAYVSSVTRLLSTSLEESRLETSQIVATFWLDPVDSKFHDERGSLDYSQARQTGQSTYEVSEASFELLLPRSNVTPDGVQGYAIYNARPEEIRVELSNIARQEEFRGGINFFEVRQTASETSVRPFLKVVVQGYPSRGVRADRLEIVFDPSQLRILPPLPRGADRIATLPTLQPATTSLRNALIPAEASTALFAISSAVQFSGLSLTPGGGGSMEFDQPGNADEMLGQLQDVVQAVFDVVTDWIQAFDVVPAGTVDMPTGPSEDAGDGKETAPSGAVEESEDEVPAPAENAHFFENEPPRKAAQHEAGERMDDTNARSSSEYGDPLSDGLPLAVRGRPVRPTAVATGLAAREGNHTTPTIGAIDQAFADMFRTTADVPGTEYRLSIEETMIPLWWSLSLLLLPSGLYLGSRKREATSALTLGDNDVRR